MRKLRNMRTNELISNLEAVVGRLNEKMNEFIQEACIVLTVAPGEHLIREHLVSLGGHYEVNLPIDVILDKVLEDKARGFVVTHNHIYQNSNPSSPDLKSFGKLLMVSSIVGVTLMDFVIFSRECTPFSFLRRSPALFKLNYDQDYHGSFLQRVPKGFMKYVDA